MREEPPDKWDDLPEWVRQGLKSPWEVEPGEFVAIKGSEGGGVGESEAVACGYPVMGGRLPADPALDSRRLLRSGGLRSADALESGRGPGAQAHGCDLRDDCTLRFAPQSAERSQGRLRRYEA